MPPRRSNKTAHVLSLLTDPKSSSTTEQSATTPDTKSAPKATKAPKKSAPAASAAPVAEPEMPPVSLAPTEEDPTVSVPTTPAAVTRNKATPPPLPSTEERLAQCIFDSLTATLKKEDILPEEPEPEPEEPPAPMESLRRHAAGFVMVNVIEEILDRYQNEYMEKFGVCTCHRCWLDVRALTLNLVDTCKYVVMDENTVPAMLNLFEHEYSGMISAQLTQACMAVLQNPRHTQ